MTPHERIIKQALEIINTLPVKHPQQAERIREALALLETHSVVPNEATREMVNAAIDRKPSTGGWDGLYTAIYKAMIEAAKESNDG